MPYERKLGPVTKLDKRNKKSPKEIDDSDEIKKLKTELKNL